MGQCFTNWFKHMGYGQEAASMYTTLCLILLSVIFTGLNLYQKLANWAGAGTIVPITGFANSVAAPAIEFQNEGMVMGVGGQNLYYRRPGNLVRNFHQLGARGVLLGVECDVRLKKVQSFRDG